MSEKKTKLYKAIAAFQQEVPVIHKGTKGYGYSYADLPTIFEVINPVLKKHGLGFTQLMEEDGIRTVVFHVESGETIESFTTIPKDVNLKGMNAFQVLGSAITYIRRYALSSVLGLVTDKDTDAGGEQTKKPAPKKPAPKKSAKKDFSKPFGEVIQAVLDGEVNYKTIVEKFNVNNEQLKQLKEADAMKSK